MRIIAAGCSGFIGTTLVARLRGAGHEVVSLVRRPPRGRGELHWTPGPTLDPQVLAGADAVVNLAGAGIGAHRWTARYKELIRTSRVASTATLATAMSLAPEPPPVLLNASAVGYYGDTGDLVVDEGSPPGRGFLASVCQDWEAAAEPARAAGCRVVHLRTGLVLGPDGGLLGRLAPLFRLGVGGRLGTGQQYLPWIAMADELAAIEFLLTAAIDGPVNLCAPEPVTNAEFTRALAAVLHRPAVLPVPAVGLRIVLGEFATEVLTGQRAIPRVLRQAGFRFLHDDLTAALREALHD